MSCTHAHVPILIKKAIWSRVHWWWRFLSLLSKWNTKCGHRPQTVSETTSRSCNFPIVFSPEQFLWPKTLRNLPSCLSWCTHLHGFEIIIQTSGVGMGFKYSQRNKQYAINLHYSSEADGQLSLPSICKGEYEVTRCTDLLPDSQEIWTVSLTKLTSTTWLQATKFHCLSEISGSFQATVQRESILLVSQR